MNLGGTSLNPGNFGSSNCEIGGRVSFETCEFLMISFIDWFWKAFDCECVVGAGGGGGGGSCVELSCSCDECVLVIGVGRLNKPESSSSDEYC